MANPGSLQNLHDIVVPDPVPFWPPAPGWYAMALLAVVLAFWICIKWYMGWRNNRYRRNALKELNELTAGSLPTERRTQVLRKLNALLKRTALAAWPRREVAHLTGDAWLAFLDGTGSTTSFGHEPVSMLSEISFVKEDRFSNVPDAKVAALISAARLWIKRHRVKGVEDRQAEAE